ncbi:hypothetical protein, partial [Streptomyces sp. NPDC127084]|uniref:hypothetical protein n=1 Tax=Streptomyces sp. NPDC127084 TaxID=3347133 RepID=UPI0036535683
VTLLNPHTRPDDLAALLKLVEGNTPRWGTARRGAPGRAARPPSAGRAPAVPGERRAGKLTGAASTVLVPPRPRPRHASG